MPEQQFQEKSPLTPMRQDATAVPAKLRTTGSDVHAGGGIIRTVSMVGAFAVESPFASARNPLEGERNDPDDDRSDCEQHDRISDACSLEYVEENTEGLAVAIPIVEEESNVFSLAVAHDPDGKPPRFRKSRWFPYALLASYILILIAVATVLLIVQGDENDTNLANTSPSYYREQGIKEQVQTIIAAEELQNLHSPYYKALQWITYKDPMQATPDSLTFLQRYFMAYFYYATTMERPWDSCNPPVAQAGETYVCTYMKLFAVLPLIKRVPLPGTRWLSEKPECEWTGVQCDNLSQIRSIDLAALNMTGSFPEGIQYFPFIQTLNIAWGELQGSVPAVIGSMKHLVNLNVDGNALTGSLPIELFALPSLQIIYVAGNQFTGIIPSEIGSLRDLNQIDISANRFSGTIPSEIGYLQNLRYFKSQRNLLSGMLPSSIGSMGMLTYLWLFENRFTGTLFKEWSGATTLSDFRIQNNAALSGTIPGELFETDCFRLEVFNCNFTGTISDKIENMTTLSTFMAANNRLSGSLPTDFSQLKALSEFSISGNHITGSIPPSLCDLWHHVLNIVEADCLAPDGGNPQISCGESCCTVCCDPTRKRCIDT